MLVEITIPVFNEEHDLPVSIRKLTEFLRGVKWFESSIVIADNASTDRTWAIAQELERAHPNVRAFHLDQKGRGRALKTVWSQSRADVVSYMDVDLSTNLKFFPLLIHGISIGYDFATGSRLLQASHTKRSLKREVLSRGYNWLVKALFWNRFSDAQCGFKALRREVAQRLLPHVQNTNWFFDTELMLLAEKHGFSIFEVPVDWIEDLDTRVKIVPTALEDIRGLLRMRLTGFRQKL
ncbi:MAG: glycosyltransferase family 2 protein [Verrucomicrobiae bacterium]|nr:glycosyltransferase family 2 protein [Verrucomicrobiae bacterium]